ncbi:hypothetical protein [Roseomonas sp. 18066]|uniref:hypothetical protein n=1 Tax=Roseomonas sp. 18066 TaxID=2681412 RepID=UPI001357D657|nr:hypothetical protein [Roseomonas sp. 18066]
MPRLLPLTGLAAVLAGGLGLNPAAAQQAQFCGGQLVANSAYTNLLPTARGGAQVEYHVLFQNRHAGGQRLGVRVLDITPIGKISFARVQAGFTLTAGSQADLIMATIQIPSPGAGAPGTAQFLQALKLECRLL